MSNSLHVAYTLSTLLTKRALCQADSNYKIRSSIPKHSFSKCRDLLGELVRPVESQQNQGLPQDLVLPNLPCDNFMNTQKVVVGTSKSLISIYHHDQRPIKVRSTRISTEQSKQASFKHKQSQVSTQADKGLNEIHCIPINFPIRKHAFEKSTSEQDALRKEKSSRDRDAKKEKIRAKQRYENIKAYNYDGTPLIRKNPKNSTIEFLESCCSETQFIEKKKMSVVQQVDSYRNITKIQEADEASRKKIVVRKRATPREEKLKISEVPEVRISEDSHIETVRNMRMSCGAVITMPDGVILKGSVLSTVGRKEFVRTNKHLSSNKGRDSVGTQREGVAKLKRSLEVARQTPLPVSTCAAGGKIFITHPPRMNQIFNEEQLLTQMKQSSEALKIRRPLAAARR